MHIHTHTISLYFSIFFLSLSLFFYLSIFSLSLSLSLSLCNVYTSFYTQYFLLHIPSWKNLRSLFSSMFLSLSLSIYLSSLSLSLFHLSTYFNIKVGPNRSFIFSNEQSIQFNINKFLPPPGLEPGSLGKISRWLIHYATVPYPLKNILYLVFFLLHIPSRKTLR